jgi:hypothetical protein
MKGRTIDKVLFFIVAASVPYMYFFLLRPNLIKFENKLDHKITNVSDKELEAMKKKMEVMKVKNENEGEQISEINEIRNNKI